MWTCSPYTVKVDARVPTGWQASTPGGDAAKWPEYYSGGQEVQLESEQALTACMLGCHVLTAACNNIGVYVLLQLETSNNAIYSATKVSPAV